MFHVFYSATKLVLVSNFWELVSDNHSQTALFIISKMHWALHSKITKKKSQAFPKISKWLSTKILDENALDNLKLLHMRIYFILCKIIILVFLSQFFYNCCPVCWFIKVCLMVFIGFYFSTELRIFNIEYFAFYKWDKYESDNFDSYLFHL